MVFGKKAATPTKVNDDGAGDKQATEQPSPAKPTKATKKGAAPQPVYKFAISHRIDEAIAAKEDSTAKRSPDLVPLTREFDVMRKHLLKMIAAAKKYHTAMEQLDKDRLHMAEEVCAFADDSPINKHVRNSADAKSFLSVHKEVSRQYNENTKKTYESDVIGYCMEWDDVVTTRVDAEQKKVNSLRETYMHYQKKVDAMREKVNAQEEKGKTIDSGTAEKLKRNDEKLDAASDEFEAEARYLCHLLEEIVHHSWKDLYQLVQSIMKCETERSTTETSCLAVWQPHELAATAPDLERLSKRNLDLESPEDLAASSDEETPSV